MIDKKQKYSMTTIHERCECTLPPDCDDWFPPTEIDMNINSSTATAYDMLDWLKSFLVAAGYTEASIYEAYQKHFEEYQQG